MSQLSLDFSASGPGSPTSVPVTLEALRRLEVVQAIDEHFARAVARLCGAPDHPSILLICAMTSRAERAGHVCVHLERDLPVQVQDRAGLTTVLQWPDIHDALRDLRSLGVVADDAQPAPLVVEDGRIYLRRNWVHERAVAEAIVARAAEHLPLSARAVEHLHQLFPRPPVPGRPD